MNEFILFNQIFNLLAIAMYDLKGDISFQRCFKTLKLQPQILHIESWMRFLIMQAVCNEKSCNKVLPSNKLSLIM